MPGTNLSMNHESESHHRPTARRYLSSVILWAFSMANRRTTENEPLALVANGSRLLEGTNPLERAFITSLLRKEPLVDSEGKSLENTPN